MAQPFIISALNSGELSPALYGRVDFNKYKTGLSLCRNFYVDPRGGIINRAGTSYVGPITNNTAYPARLIPFTFNTEQTYVLVFGGDNFIGGVNIRFVTNGGYVLEAAINVADILPTNPATFTVPGPEPYLPGDLIYLQGMPEIPQLNDKFFIVATVNILEDTFTVNDLYGNPISAVNYPPYTNGGTVSRVYTVPTPYAGTDLPLLKYTQNADVLTLVHPSYEPSTLTRYGNANWKYQAISFGPTVAQPTNVAAAANTSGTTTYNYAVSAVIGLIQSRQSNPASVTGATLSLTATATNTVTWNAVAGATSYNVYRTQEIEDSGPPPGAIYGFIGTTTGTSLIDNNISPNFAITAPQARNPFQATNMINSVVVTNGGSGYLPSITASISDPTGSGAVIVPTIVGGVITAMTVTSPGDFYTRPTVQISANAGSGAYITLSIDTIVGTILSATVTAGGSGYVHPVLTVVGPYGSGAVLTPTVASGVITGVTITNAGVNYNPQLTSVLIVDPGSGSGATFSINETAQLNLPACACYYQERAVYGGTSAQPDQINFSKSGDYNNFDTSFISQDDDAIQITIASQQLNGIKSMVPFNSLIVLTEGTCWAINSGISGGPLTPSSIQALPQSFNGASDVQPLVIGYEILYVQNKQAAVRDLTYNFYANLYTGTDISVLSSHLFYSHKILEWCWSQEPNKIVWAVREDGILLALTFIKEQEVYAWTRHDTTNGQFVSVASISEGQEDAVYVIVNRFINGQYLQYVERMQSRLLGGDIPRNIPGSLDNCWFVDAGLQTALVYPAATLTPITVSAQPSVTSVAVIVAGSGYTSPTIVINDPTGMGAVLTAIVSGGIITAINVISGGTNYTDPQVAIYDTSGTGAVVQAVTQNLVTMNLSSAVLNSGNVGDAIRINGCFGYLASVSGTTIQVNVQLPLNSIWPATSGNWSCTPLITNVIGLDHLDGQTVSILADGNVQPQQMVVNGGITLQQPASLVTAGLPITAQAQSMYLDTGENPTMQTKRVQVNAITARVMDSRGLQVGHSFDDLYEIKERTTQPLGWPIQLITTDERTTIDPALTTPAQIVFQQSQPLPAHVQALIIELSEGDTR